MCLVAPDDPTYTYVGETEFVTRRINRDNTWKTEIPFELGLAKNQMRDYMPLYINRRTVANGARKAPDAPST